MDKSLRETTTVLASLRAAAVASRDSTYPRPPTPPPAGRGYLLRRALILAELDAMSEVLASCTSAWSVNVSGRGGKRNGGEKRSRDLVPDSEDESPDEDAKENGREEEQELQRAARPDDDDNDDNAGGARRGPGLLTEPGQGQSGAFACLERHKKKLGSVSVVWGDDAQSRDADTRKTGAVRKARLVGLGEREVVVMVGTGGNEALESEADESTSSFHGPRSALTNTTAAANMAPQTPEDGGGGGGGKKMHDEDSTEDQEGVAAVLTERELRGLVQEINALVSYAIPSVHHRPPFGSSSVCNIILHTYTSMVSTHTHTPIRGQNSAKTERERDKFSAQTSQ